MKLISGIIVLLGISFFHNCFSQLQQPQQQSSPQTDSALPRGESGFWLGMTIEQFKGLNISYAMFESSKSGTALYDYRINSAIPDVRTASLGFGKASHILENIHISYDDNYSSKRKYEKLIKGMEDKYGPPVKREDSFTSYCVWQDKQTKVTIGFHGGAKPDLFKEYAAVGRVR